MEATCKPISKLKELNYPLEIITFDTESTIHHEDKSINEYHSLRLGVAIYNKLDSECKTVYREVYYFRTSTEFWNYVETKTSRVRTLYIYAHNAKYDTLNVDVINELNRLEYEIPYPTINNAFIISAKKNKKKIKIVDTFNYVKKSVASIGEKLGIKKLSVDFNNVEDKELFEYCENDTHIVEEFMLQLIRFLFNNKLGSLKFTTASTAMDIYRHSFITEPIYYHRNLNILKLERDSYRGGIVECFYLGRMKRGEYYLLDINSMYVNVMSKYKLPTYPIMRIVDNEEHPINFNDFVESSKNNYLIADVLIVCDINVGLYGLKYDGKLIFPTGEFRVSLHQGELEIALKHGHIKAVYEYIIYHAEYCARDYANYFSNLKINATNEVDRDFAKLLGNGWYGKLAMMKYLTDSINLMGFFSDEELKDNGKSEYKLVGDKRLQSNIRTHDNSRNDNRRYMEDEKKITISNNMKGRIIKQHFLPASITTNNGDYFNWNGDYIRQYRTGLVPVPRTNVALSGAVTTYARLLLNHYISICGEGNVYYTDTDSLTVNKLGYERLKMYIDDKELGKLKCELQFNSGTINAPKNYTFSVKKKIQLKSIQSINRNFNADGLILEQKSIILKRRDRSKGIPTSAINDNGTFYYWRFTTFKEFLKSDGELKGRIYIHRKNSLDYNKGIEQNNGFTLPYELEYSYDEELKCLKNKITNQQKIMKRKIIVRN